MLNGWQPHGFVVNRIQLLARPGLLMHQNRASGHYFARSVSANVGPWARQETFRQQWLQTHRDGRRREPPQIGMGIPAARISQQSQLGIMAPFQRFGQGHLVGVIQVTAHREPPGDARHLVSHRLQ